MQKILKEKFKAELSKAPFDHMAVGLLDFKKKRISTASLLGEQGTYFDLASVTKVLTLAGAKLINPHLFDDSMDLLLNHRAGLPAWGLLPCHAWKEQLLSYEIKKSPVLYSDYSALRLMLEIEKKQNKSLHELMKFHWHSEIVFWKELDLSRNIPCYGSRHGHPIQAQVHDPNAFNLSCFTSHAGLFGTIEGLLGTILQWNEEFELLLKMEKLLKSQNSDERYIAGWDTLTNSKDSLAGRDLGPLVFGHLGFTGTSLWIDASSQRAVAILSNAVRDYWYERETLNFLRKEIGTFLFHEKDLL